MPRRKRSPRRNPAPLIILIVLAGTGYLLWRLYFAAPVLPANVVSLSGRIEGDDSAVAPKTTGRLLEVRVREGDEVKAGDVIAVLDDPVLEDRRNQARAALAAAEARATSSKAQIAVRELISDLSQSASFRLTRSYLDPEQLSNDLTDGTVQAGIIIPYDFTRNLQRGQQAEVQFLLNAIDANTATIARNYAQGVTGAYSAGLSSGGLHARFSEQRALQAVDSGDA